MNDDLPAMIGDVIRRRKTEKVTCEVDEHREVPAELAAKYKRVLLEALEVAGWAPFHFPRKVDGIAEPWRAYVLTGDSLKNVAVHLRDELEITTKLPKLVAGSNALILVTWLPEFDDPESRTASKLDAEAQRQRDEEHLAAASAMVQNLLLMLTAHGMGNYWSSGGAFRGPEMFDHLGIPTSERLLAAVFVEYPEMMEGFKQRKAGSQRNNRGQNWFREVTV